jgi:hypothetical protein
LISLEDCLSDFEVCARCAVETILRTPTRMRRCLTVEGGTDEAIPLLCTIRNGSDGSHDFQVGFHLGVRERDLDGLLGKIPDPALRMDVLGEIMNTFAGNLLGRKSFFSRFGRVAPSLPFFGEEAKMDDESHRIEAIMQINSVDVRLALTVSANGTTGGR